MSSLRQKLIKLAHTNPEFRKDILPLLKEGTSKEAANFDQARKNLGDMVQSVQKMINDYVDTGNTLTLLIGKGEARRLGRAAAGVQIRDANYDGQKITAHPTGSKGEKYDTRITLAPKRGHHCTCADWAQRGATVGPCKHVLALAMYWRDKNVEPALTGIEDRLTRVLELPA